MSTADDAWQEHKDDWDWTDWRADDVYSGFKAGYAVAYRRALEDAADAWQQGQWSDALSGTQRPSQVQMRVAVAQAVTDWLRARVEARTRPPVDIPDRAAGIGTKDGDDEAPHVHQWRTFRPYNQPAYQSCAGCGNVIPAPKDDR